MNKLNKLPETRTSDLPVIEKNNLNTIYFPDSPSSDNIINFPKQGIINNKDDSYILFDVETGEIKSEIKYLEEYKVKPKGLNSPKINDYLMSNLNGYISPTTIKLFNFICKNLSNFNHYTLDIRHEAAKEFSSSSITKGIKKLKELGLISAEDNILKVYPAYAYKGADAAQNIATLRWITPQTDHEKLISSEWTTNYINSADAPLSEQQLNNIIKSLKIKSKGNYKNNIESDDFQLPIFDYLDSTN